MLIEAVEMVPSEPCKRPESSVNPEQRANATLREIDSQELMRGNREIVIRHGTQAYRLSITRSGKLILRK